MRIEHGERGAAAHEVAVVAAAGVVALQPVLELGVEVDEAIEALAVERRSVELVQGDALKAFAHRVVVGRAGRSAVVGDPRPAMAALNAAGTPGRCR
jgi:hypothetical protein